MRKKVISILLTAAMAVTLFAGCGDEKSADSQGNQSSGDAKTVTMMSWYSEDQMDDVIDAIEKKLGGEYKIDYTYVTNSDYNNVLSTQLAAGEGPDIIADGANFPARIKAGNVKDITDAVLASSREAVTLCFTMFGIVAFWSGLMEVAVDAGIMKGMTKLLKPVMGFLFPKIPKEHPALTSISANFVANILGLGWAATPAGLRAMSELAHLEEERGKLTDVASDEMCTFLVINISSLQLIPVNIIAYRSQYGSVNPAGIIAPAILATLTGTLVAVFFCKWKTKAVKHQFCACKTRDFHA